MVVSEGLAVNRREAKGKGEKERQKKREHKSDTLLQSSDLYCRK